jgi:hypothetical protein
MNKYEVISVVGEGAYGIVLKCKNRVRLMFTRDGKPFVGASLNRGREAKVEAQHRTKRIMQGDPTVSLPSLLSASVL